MVSARRGAPVVWSEPISRPSLTRDGVVSALSVTLPAARTIACSQFVADGFREAWRSRRVVRADLETELDAGRGGECLVRHVAGSSHHCVLAVCRGWFPRGVALPSCGQSRSQRAYRTTAHS